jgi:hypothetical protein
VVNVEGHQEGTANVYNPKTLVNQMTNRTTKTSPLTYARVAGVLYLSLVPLAFFGFPFGPSHLFVPGDAVTTANNLIASESLFRLSIVINLLGAIVNATVVLALYQLLKVVNKNIASLMVIFLLLSVPIAMLNELNHVAVLILLSGADYLKVFTTSQSQALVLFFHDLHKYGLNIAEVFWGLWLFPMGYLVFKSGFLPRILGALLIIGCFGYLIVSLTAFLLPNYSVGFLRFAAIGEVLLPLWLVIKGVNVEQWEKRAAESA